MENVYIVLRPATLSLLIIMSAMPALTALAERTAEVTLRYSRQDSLIRVVLESDDETVRGAAVAPSLSAVRIEFPARFELRQQKDMPFELARKDRTVTLNLRDITEVKTYRLSSPARIVIDLRPAVKASKEAPRPDQKQETRTQQQTQPVPQTQRPPDTGQAKTAEQAPAERGRRIRVIMIDAGHGGFEAGIVTEQAKEKDVNLTVARDLYNVLTKKGYTVLMTRRADQPSSLTERINFANGKNPELFISIHASSSDQPAVYTAALDEQVADAVKLFSTAYRQSRHLLRSRALAKTLADALKTDLGAEVQLRELPLPVLASMNSVAVMVDYPSVNAYGSDAKLREKFANAVARGIAVNEQ